MRAMCFRALLMWVVMGIAYNGISLARVSQGHSPLVPTDPIAGAIFVGVIGSLLLWTFLRHWRIYRWISSVATMLLAYSGIYLHVVNRLQDPTLPSYLSTFWWTLAIGINALGVLALIASQLPGAQPETAES